MPEPEYPRLRALVLVGGQSTRMGFPKYLLPMPFDSSCTSSRPLLLHLLDILGCVRMKHPDPFIESMTISVRNEAQQVEVTDLIKKANTPPNCAVNFVIDVADNAGPAQGLLAAFNLDPNSHWLVTGCDYPLLRSDVFEQLITAHHRSKKAVTCFQNEEGFSEPLLSVWTPSSLTVLADLAGDASSSIGPNQAIKFFQRTRSSSSSELVDVGEYEYGVEFVRPPNADAIKSIDTEDQWKAVQNKLLPFR